MDSRSIPGASSKESFWFYREKSKSISASEGPMRNTANAKEEV